MASRRIPVSNKFLAFTLFVAPEIANHAEPNFDTRISTYLDINVYRQYRAWKQTLGIYETSETRVIQLLFYWKAEKGNIATVEKFIEALEPHSLTGEIVESVREWQRTYREDGGIRESMVLEETYLRYGTFGIIRGIQLQYFQHAPSPPETPKNEHYDRINFAMACGTIIVVVFVVFKVGVPRILESIKEIFQEFLQYKKDAASNGSMIMELPMEQKCSFHGLPMQLKQL